ncbi:MAG: hypothetical protein JMN27_07085 [gamma proteobacterium endosymbiont of Lamellibrachia anaximandri]|nr:hypothetical protein [gamma proteobacterium endosymbiont of Lamellibrachia anaximandri]MBL3533581.1 hypothetical protein [gamma proteobacterium endosymbiont of Lamellibrachia anaximandri]
MQIVFSAEKTARTLLWIVAFLTIASTLGQISHHFFGHSRLFGLVYLFNLNREWSIPSFYASFAVLFCSLLLTLIAWVHHRRGEMDFKYWYGLAVIFLLLAIDEYTDIHNRIFEPVHSHLKAIGMISYAWLLVYVPLLLAMLLIYRRFLTRLPEQIAKLLILAGVVYLVGAIGINFIGDQYTYSERRVAVSYAVIYTLEELCEMLGIIMFIYALLKYMEGYIGQLALVFLDREK